jgi:hypothetical protein
MSGSSTPMAAPSTTTTTTMADTSRPARAPRADRN